MMSRFGRLRNTFDGFAPRNRHIDLRFHSFLQVPALPFPKSHESPHATGKEPLQENQKRRHQDRPNDKRIEQDAHRHSKAEFFHGLQ